MVQLVAQPPEPNRFMSHSMPSIINKTRNQISNKSGCEIAHVFADAEERPSLHPAVPGVSCQQHNRELNQIYQRHSRPPSSHFWQCVGRPEPFDDEEPNGDGYEQVEVHKVGLIDADPDFFSATTNAPRIPPA